MVIDQAIATTLELAKENRKIQIAGLGTGSREKSNIHHAYCHFLFFLFRVACAMILQFVVY